MDTITVIYPGDVPPHRLKTCVMYYRVSSDEMLYRNGDPPPGKIMGIYSYECGGSKKAAAAISAECRKRGYTGVFFACRGDYGQTAKLLAPLSVYSFQGFGIYAIPAEISGGSFDDMLSLKLRGRSPDSACLFCRLTGSVFDMPSATAEGTEITPEELKKLKEKHGSRDYFSEEMLCRYFTFSEGKKIKFALFDDRDSVMKKAERGGDLGLGCAFIPYFRL